GRGARGSDLAPLVRTRRPEDLSVLRSRASSRPHPARQTPERLAGPRPPRGSRYTQLLPSNPRSAAPRKTWPEARRGRAAGLGTLSNHVAMAPKGPLRRDL